MMKRTIFITLALFVVGVVAAASPLQHSRTVRTHSKHWKGSARLPKRASFRQGRVAAAKFGSKSALRSKGAKKPTVVCIKNQTSYTVIIWADDNLVGSLSPFGECTSKIP